MRVRKDLENLFQNDPAVVDGVLLPVETDMALTPHKEKIYLYNKTGFTENLWFDAWIF